MKTYVKSPVASLCFVCSSVRKRVKVTIFVFIVAVSAEGTSFPLLLVAILLRALTIELETEPKKGRTVERELQVWPGRFT